MNMYVANTVSHKIHTEHCPFQPTVNKITVEEIEKKYEDCSYCKPREQKLLNIHEVAL